MRWRELERNAGMGVTGVTKVAFIGNTRASAYEESGDPCDGCDRRAAGVPNAPSQTDSTPLIPVSHRPQTPGIVTLNVT